MLGYMRAQQIQKKREAERLPMNVRGRTTATMFAVHGWDLVVFGPCPNPHRSWSYATGSARRIGELLGRPATWFNLFEREPENWSKKAARESAEEWCLTYQRRLPYRMPLMLLGTKVCNAFGIDDPVWLESYASALWSPMIAFPHPSGLNRWWNDPENAARAEDVARRLGERTYYNYEHTTTRMLELAGA